MNTVSKIKSLREKKGYSQEFMATQLKINQSSYSRIESGFIKLDLVKLKCIAKVLDVNVQLFMECD